MSFYRTLTLSGLVPSFFVVFNFLPVNKTMMVSVCASAVPRGNGERRGHFLDWIRMKFRAVVRRALSRGAGGGWRGERKRRDESACVRGAQHPRPFVFAFSAPSPRSGTDVRLVEGGCARSRKSARELSRSIVRVPPSGELTNRRRGDLSLCRELALCCGSTGSSFSFIRFVFIPFVKQSRYCGRHRSEERHFLVPTPS